MTQQLASQASLVNVPRPSRSWHRRWVQLWRPAGQPRGHGGVVAMAYSRRDSLSLLTSGLIATPLSQAATAAAAAAASSAPQPAASIAAASAASSAAAAAAGTAPAQPAVSFPNYAGPGPFQPARLPPLEHICARCFPQCTTDQCILKINVVYPRGGSTVGGYPRCSRIGLILLLQYHCHDAG